MASIVDENITKLYELFDHARGLPLGSDKVMISRDQVLDMLDEISNSLPAELKQARTIVESRNEVITNAKREAENIQKQAEERARKLVSEHEIYLQAQEEAKRMIETAQERVRELRRVTYEYVDDALRRTEESVTESLSQLRDSRSRFNALTGTQSGAETPEPEET